MTVDKGSINLTISLIQNKKAAKKFLTYPYSKK